MHSVFSDGSMTPEELVDAGRKAGLRAMALTDHDTLAGVPRFLEAAQRAGISAVSGVEVSADAGEESIHMLGYGIDPNHPALKENLEWIRDGRVKRNAEILHKLNRLGIRIREEEVMRVAGPEVVGRPHIAQVMVEKGYVSSKREAFDRYLGRGKPAYADRRRLTAEATIELIREAGGVSVLAHPYVLKLSKADLTDFVRRLKAVGLVGIEVYYSEHTPDLQKLYLALAEECGLLATGGSDFHGEMSPGISLGRGTGALHVPDSVWDALQSALSHRQ